MIVLAGCSGGDSAPAAKPLSPELVEVMNQVAEVRGLPPAEGVRAGTVPARDLPEKLESVLTDDDKAAFERLTTFYRLLGHLSPEQDYLSVYREFAGDRIAGFYSPPEKVFYINSTAEEVDFGEFSAQQRSTTAHEFVHALQDAAFDFGSFAERTKDDLDWSLALSAVIEGDAVVHEGLWAQKHALLPGPHTEPPLARRPFASVPASIEREFVFPYTSGTEWVSLVRSQRGIEAINGVLRGRRITTAEILHPELYDSGWQPREVSLPDLSASLGEGWDMESEGAFGEFQLRNLLQLELGGLPSVTGAAGWAGDAYTVYENEGHSVAVLRIAFSDDAQAREFRDLFRDWLDAAGDVAASGETLEGDLSDGRGVRLVASGSEALLIFGSDRDLATRTLRLVAGG